MAATVLLMDNPAAAEEADHAAALKETEHYKRWKYYLRECQLDNALSSALHSHVRSRSRLPLQGSQQNLFCQAAPASAER
eukprot:5009604-Pleurochrysis_carterae.AAC.1